MYKIVKSLNGSSLKQLEHSHGAFCRKDVDNLFKYFCTIEQDYCHACIYQVKTLKNIFFRTKKTLKLNLGVQHQGHKV